MSLLRWGMVTAGLLFTTVAVQAGERVVAYVPNWIDLPAFARAIDYTEVTHLNIAFENPTDEEGNLSCNPGDAVLVATAQAHGVPVLVSIGGGGASGDKTLVARYAGLLSDEKRAGFVRKLAGYVSAHGLAGLDVDLEGPGIPPNYGPFIAELGAVLHAHGKLLTAALSYGYGGEKVPDTVLRFFDFVNVMGYDATGTWAKDRPGQHSSLEYAQEGVQYWLRRGLPKDKAVLGVPFYGYGFGNAYRDHDYAYKELVAKFPGAENQDQVGETIWYNGLATIRAKAAYVREQGLGGVMIWSLDDDVPGPRSLLGAIHAGLQPNTGE